MTKHWFTTTFAGLLIMLVVAGNPVAAQEIDGTGSPGSASAGEEPPKFGIQPVGIEGTYWDLELEPGSRTDLTVQLINGGENPEQLRTYATNVGSQVNGGLDIISDGEPTGTTTWLDYQDETLEIPAGKSIERTFTVTIPDDVKPGQYLTSVVLETAEPVNIPSQSDGGIMINQMLRQAISVAIRIPGPEKPELTIGEASYSLSTAAAAVQVAVKNSGNVHVRPDAELILSSQDGQEITRSNWKLATIYAGTATFVELALLQPLQPGQYLISLSLSDTEPEFESESRDLPLTVKNVDANGTPIAVAPAIAIESVTVNELRDPRSNALQGADLVVSIDNPAPPIANARLTLHVSHDGQPVEDYVLGSSLSFPGGSAEFRQRYLPMSGWTPGVWSFSVTLDVVDPTTGEVVELTTVQAETTVTVS
jgi:hypothetical protein